MLMDNMGEYESYMIDPEEARRMREEEDVPGRYILLPEEMFTPELFAKIGPQQVLYWMTWFAERRN